MTPRQSITLARDSVQAAATLRGVAYSVVLIFTPSGASVGLRNDETDTLPIEGVSYRVVAESDDPDEAAAVVDLLRRRVDAGEFGWHHGRTKVRPSLPRGGDS
jgi:hypothetical protein